MNDQDKLLKLLKYIHRRKDTPDLHSFVARCAGGESVSVEVTADGMFSVNFYGGTMDYGHVVSSAEEAQTILQNHGIDVSSAEI